MKKIIAILVALAMVLSMSVLAFAEFNGVKAPDEIQYVNGQEDYDEAALKNWDLEDYGNWWRQIDARKDIKAQGIYTKDDGSLMNWEESWKAYYVYVLQNASSDMGTAATEIVSIVQEGYIPAGDAISIAGETVMGGIGGDGGSGDLSGVIDELLGTITGGNQDPEISTPDYVDELAELINNGASFDEITQKISDDIASGKIVVSQLPDIANELTERVTSGEIAGNETVQQILGFLKGLGSGSEGGGSKFPSFGDITLPWDNDNSSSGSFLDTLLGIIGSIGDLFNPSDDPEENPGTSDPSDEFSGDDNMGEGENPDTGDISFVAVAAVAAVAGAALILTRKKNDDAE